MDETSDEEIEFRLFNLMVYSKGGLDWKTLQEMPFPQINALITYANKLTKAQEATFDNEQRNSRGRS